MNATVTSAGGPKSDFLPSEQSHPRDRIVPAALETATCIVPVDHVDHPESESGTRNESDAPVCSAASTRSRRRRVTPSRSRTRASNLDDRLLDDLVGFSRRVASLTSWKTRHLVSFKKYLLLTL